VSIALVSWLVARFTGRVDACGHTFVVQGDLTRLACDLVLIPTDITGGVTRDFKGLGHPLPPGWSSDHARVTDHVPGPGFGDCRLRRWVDVGSVPFLADVEWLLEGVRQALDAAGRSVNCQTPLNGRACPLVAMPLFGTGAGGFDAVRGAVLDGILTECEEAASRHGFDVVIVCWQRSDYAALQARRLSRSEERWPLPGGLVRKAGGLGRLAQAGKLALFIGAGVSKAAGLPSWSELIGELAEQSRKYGARSAELAEIPVVDAARLLEKDLGPKFRESLERVLGTPLHAIGHALLASLRVQEAITTNFDTLYEQACAATYGERLRKLPWERAEPGLPWLLKMHGDLGRHHQMVLSRDEYLGYDARWRPLASMLQAAMMTRHVLFVGCSLHDENFVRLEREVSLLLRQMGLTQQVGTALTLHEAPLLLALFEEDLQILPMTPDTDQVAA
jgi:NAD-dependent SIR2 family protein deacetylase